jgi:hypothetical protein
MSYVSAERMPQAMTDSLSNHIAKIAEQSAQDPFWALRGRAIQSYADIEQSLCVLFASLIGVDINTASAIFFRIQSTRTLGEIFQQLMTHRYQDRYYAFWTSLAKSIQQATETRNKIVHWNVANMIGGNGFAVVALIPPDLYNVDTEEMKTIDSAAIVVFMRRCNFISRLCRVFNLYITRETALDGNLELKKLWVDTFQQAVVYPPPDAHPLNWKAKPAEAPPGDLRLQWESRQSLPPESRQP